MSGRSWVTITQVVDSTAEPAFATSAGLRIMAWNSAAERLLGYGSNEVIGRPCYAVLRATDGAGTSFCGTECPFLATLAQGRPAKAAELSVQCAEGPPVSVMASVFAVPVGKGSDTTLVHVLSRANVGQDPDRNVTDRERPLTGCLQKPEANVNGYALTERESQVLRLLAQGKGTRRMADDLYISPATVRSHIQSITSKLDVHTRLQAVIVANQQQLV